jgi:hypothetical protein
MKDTFYFSHDYNARNDSKIKKLLSKYGFTGYGLFWAIIEDLYNNANALPTDYDSIAFDLRTDKKTIQDIITGFDLFIIDGDIFGSHSIEKRLEERNEKSAMARKSALKRWNKDANALPTQYDSNAIKESIVKEKKIPFETFWKHYPRKEAKPKAKEKWDKLPKETQEKIIVTLPTFLKGKEAQFIPMPVTYFNNQRWDDELNHQPTMTEEQIKQEKIRSFLERL